MATAKIRRRRAGRPLVPPGPLFLLLGAGAAGALAAILSLRFRLHPLVSWLAAANAASFCLYGLDKLASAIGILRVPERTLHILDFAGGTPAALIARRLFRHKTSRPSFRRTFRLLAILQAALIAWALWAFGLPAGR